MNKKWNRWMVVAVLATLWSLSPTHVVSAEQLQWGKGSLSQWSNGAKVTSETNSSGSVEISTSTQGLEKGYYSAYFYELQNRDWSGYGELTFSVRNESDGILPLNIVLTSTDQSAVTISDQRNVIIVPKQSKKPELVHPVGGLIKLEPGFAGQIRVPFNSLMIRNKAETTGHIQPGKLLSWGITTTTVENTDLKFRVGDIKLVTGEQAETEKSLSRLSLVGDARVVKPVVGESIAQYKVDAGSKIANHVKFELALPVQGASITSDGLLTLQADTEAELVTVRAIVDQKWNLDYNVILDRSSAMRVKESDGTLRTIPSPEMSTRVLGSSKVLLRPWVEWSIRIGLTILGILVVVPYWLWRRRQTTTPSRKRLSMHQRKARRPFRI